MSTTLMHIASKAGVSAGTVSRILNGRIKGNRPAIARRADRVRQIAAQLGYRPNAAARSMVSGRFGLVALVACADVGSDWFPRELLHGLHAGLEQLGMRLVVNQVRGERLADPAYVPWLLRESAVDGLMIYPHPAFSEHTVAYFEQQRQTTPVVWLNLKRPRRAVYPDDARGPQLAVDYLVERGHARIGYLCRPQSSRRRHYSEADRCRGFARAMRRAGLDPSRTRVVRDEALPHCTPEFARAFLDDHPDVTAVVCYEMEEAIAVRAAAGDRGMRVPDDLAIVAFSGAPVRAYSGLSIPTVIVPFEQVGLRAVEMLTDMLAAAANGGAGGADRKSAAVPYTVIES